MKYKIEPIRTKTGRTFWTVFNEHNCYLNLNSLESWNKWVCYYYSKRDAEQALHKHLLSESGNIISASPVTATDTTT